MIVTNSTIVYAPVGQEAFLICETDNQTDSIAWYFNNVPLTLGPSAQWGRLDLTPLKEEYSGWYTCAAVNSYGRSERDFLLIVVGKFFLSCLKHIIL